MLSPRLRQQIFSLWTMFWSSGMTNPLIAIEQITYLLFLKRLEMLDYERQRDGKHSLYGRRPHCSLPHHPDDSKDIDLGIPAWANAADYEQCIGHGTCRWSYIKRGVTTPDLVNNQDITPHMHLSQYVFPWLRVLEKTLQTTENGTNGLQITGAPMEDAYFQLPSEKTATLQKALQYVEDLFKQVGSSNDDIMGDIFEYLLSEIQTSGKNGQFRTPRHIIRFMIELLNPDYFSHIADPAAGTAGFLINSIQHVLRRYTPSETVVLEWDGTPHRLNGADLPEPYPDAAIFTGYDNDRTMARIGWMNMILHGIENPTMQLKDTLGKAFEDKDRYDIVLANPPFTGTVDEDDLSERFPNNPTDRKKPITNKSELLFIWLILDLLKVGGRAAVIVPEGVLFGSTNAHKELRRQLLLENEVESVISLPAGVFQPYTGVKTSILIFRKFNEVCRPGMEPHTKQVWFYEVASDGYTLDAKRNPKPEPNDLWDALEKWQDGTPIAENTDYYQPEIYTVRWRLVDDVTIRSFPQLASRLALEKDRIRGIHELFPGIPRDPKEATQLIVGQQAKRIRDLYRRYLDNQETRLNRQARTRKIAKETFDQAVKDVNRFFDDIKKSDLLEKGKDLPEYARKALDPLLQEVRKESEEDVNVRIDRVMATVSNDFDARFYGEASNNDDQVNVENNWQAEVEAIVREFAKLDGYDVQLRSQEVAKKEGALKESKCWAIPLRTFARNDTWVSSDGKLTGSHDASGRVRSQYVEDRNHYNIDGTVITELLDASCIEYNDFNLSAGRYKPFAMTAVDYEPPAQVIRALQGLEGQIQEGLGKLLAMVEGRE